MGKFHRTSRQSSCMQIRLHASKATFPVSRISSLIEVVGALVSVLMIWLVTGILVYLAIMRVIHQHYEIDGMVMLITSAIGVAVNMV